MLIQKRLLEQLINMASDSAEYLNSGEHWITVHPHGKDSKGQPLLVKDGETSKEAVDRKFGDGKTKTSNFIGKKYYDRRGTENIVTGYHKGLQKYMVSTGLTGIHDLYDEKELQENIDASADNKKRVDEEEAKKVQQAKEQEIAEKEYKDIKGFAEDKSEMQKGKIQKTLNEKINYSTYGYLKRKEGIKLITEDGYKPKTRIEKEKTKYMLFNDETKRYYDINKTEYEYAEYLLNL